MGVPIASQAAADASFSVVAGQRYYVALGTDEGIGYFQASFSIGTATALAGDYNNNGRVDAADYSLWRNTLGSSTDLRADGNGSGKVDTADYSFWKQRYGQTAGASASALGFDISIPEPSAICLFAIAVLATPWRKRRQPFQK